MPEKKEGEKGKRLKGEKGKAAATPYPDVAAADFTVKDGGRAGEPRLQKIFIFGGGPLPAMKV